MGDRRSRGRPRPAARPQATLWGLGELYLDRALFGSIKVVCAFERLPIIPFACRRFGGFTRSATGAQFASMAVITSFGSDWVVVGKVGEQLAIETMRVDEHYQAAACPADLYPLIFRTVVPPAPDDLRFPCHDWARPNRPGGSFCYTKRRDVEGKPGVYTSAHAG